MILQTCIIFKVKEKELIGAKICISTAEEARNRETIGTIQIIGVSHRNAPENRLSYLTLTEVGVCHKGLEGVHVVHHGQVPLAHRPARLGEAVATNARLLPVDSLLQHREAVVARSAVGWRAGHRIGGRRCCKTKRRKQDSKSKSVM